ncbi:MAG: penicillin-binding protein activator LpoB [Spirochaetaceae bacterium]|jgi:TolB-like protein|nr:penicillin-binding protein activator LpoB [Spirochaetaceae bacterium]
MMKRVMAVPVLVLMAAAVFAQAKPRLGILPFTGGTGGDGNTMANLFANSRELQQGFVIVPRTSSVDTIMQEQQFQRSGITDSDRIAELGKQMNAEYVVSGHIASLGNANLLLISIVDVKTMQQTAGDYREYNRIEEVRSLFPSMAANIIASIQGQSGPSGAALAVLPLNIQDPTVRQGDAEILARILATDIANGHKYAVFPRTSTINAVLNRERQIQNSSMTDRATMIEIGKATNAEYVLAGTISKLGRMNLFDVKILHIESGAQVEGGGADREYADLSDGIELMSALATDITGVEVGRYAEARQSERNAAAAAMTEYQRQLDAEQRWLEAERKRQAEEDFKNGLDRFFRSGNRFTSLGGNLGLGFGNNWNQGSSYSGYEYTEETGLDFNFFGNISGTVPLVWTLFAEGGADFGFLGSIHEKGNHSNNEENKIYLASRWYFRVNISFPVGDRAFWFLPYLGLGFGSTSATYKFQTEEKQSGYYIGGAYYSTSTCKIITDTEDFFKTSFGRIFGYAENRALRGFRRLRGRSAPLQSLAHFDAPQGVSTILMSDNLAADFKLISFG